MHYNYATLTHNPRKNFGVKIKTKLLVNLLIGVLAGIWLAYRELAMMHPSLFH